MGLQEVGGHGGALRPPPELFAQLPRRPQFSAVIIEPT